VAWYVGNSGGTTRPVKQLNPNAWGFYDMTGNVKEWCENKYRDTVKVVSEERSIRGGEFNVKVDYLRCDGRDQMEPNSYSEMVGFRVARYL
jgi:formylglycine-generating enzyme required for sulfatase activity